MLDENYKPEKPPIAPANNNDNEEISVRPYVKDVNEIVTSTIIDIPPQSPSNPSIKLTALLIPTIHPIVTKIAIAWEIKAGKNGKVNPFKAISP